MYVIDTGLSRKGLVCRKTRVKYFGKNEIYEWWNGPGPLEIISFFQQ